MREDLLTWLLAAALALYILGVWLRRDRDNRQQDGAEKTRDTLTDTRVGIEGRVASMETAVRKIEENQSHLATTNDMNQLKQMMTSMHENQKDLAKVTNKKIDRMEEFFIEEGMRRR